MILMKDKKPVQPENDQPESVDQLDDFDQLDNEIHKLQDKKQKLFFARQQKEQEKQSKELNRQIKRNAEKQRATVQKAIKNKLQIIKGKKLSVPCPACLRNEEIIDSLYLAKNGTTATVTRSGGLPAMYIHLYETSSGIECPFCNFRINKNNVF